MGNVTELPTASDRAWREREREIRERYRGRHDAECTLDEMLPLAKRMWDEVFPAESTVCVELEGLGPELPEEVAAAVNAYTIKAGALVVRLNAARVTAFGYAVGYLFEAIYFRRLSDK